LNFMVHKQQQKSVFKLMTDVCPDFSDTDFIILFLVLCQQAALFIKY